MELSLPAWLGALCGMIVAVVIYVPGIRLVERHLRDSSGVKTSEQRVVFEEPHFGFRRRHFGRGRLLDRQHVERCAGLT